MVKKKRKLEEKGLKHICKLFGSTAAYSSVKKFERKYGYVPSFVDKY